MWELTRIAANIYHAGRILLAGDAAHVHSPAGGQGMNTGIQNAAMLGHALAAGLAIRAAESQLDAYERTRRPVAERAVAFTDRMTRVATLRSGRNRSVRNGVIGVIGRIPAVQRRLAVALAGLRTRWGPRRGQKPPNPALQGDARSAHAPELPRSTTEFREDSLQ